MDKRLLVFGGLFVCLMLLFAVASYGATQKQIKEEVSEASFRLYVQVVPPGARQIQTFAFCSASMYETEETDPEYTYGTTAGHCTSLYEMISQIYEKQIWGLEMRLMLSPTNDPTWLVPVEVVTHGLRAVQRRRMEQIDGDDDELPPMPDPESVNDWAIIKTKTNLPAVPLADTDSLSTGDDIRSSGFPFAMGGFWTEGRATPHYSLPGTVYDDYIAVDYVAASGSSGSVVVNKDGEMVGIHVAGFPGGPGLVTPIRAIDFPMEAPSAYVDYSGDYPSRYSTHSGPINIIEHYDQYHRMLTPRSAGWSGGTPLKQTLRKIKQFIEGL